MAKWKIDIDKKKQDEKPVVKQYTVVKGDCLWCIASRTEY
jgi:LysM repeat protein